MAVLYNQPIAHRFGTSLNAILDSREWHSFEAAVAWVRRSGTQHLMPSLTGFLSSGGTARLTVGVDIENTSREGLEDLLSLEANGQAETYIYHNEAAVTFHPKLYLFANTQRARLIVGSNNLTEAGLFANTEAGLELDAGSDDPVIAGARSALQSWCDISANGLARRLDATLLSDLERLGYVLPEGELVRRRRQSERAGRGRRSARERLFRRQRVTIPRPPARTTGAVLTVGRVLLMRVRRASETARRTQIQLPKRVLDTQFFLGVRAIQSGHDGRVHRVHEAMARGIVNTLKVEIPEIDPVADPVLRLERTASGIIYQAFDANSVLGRPIMDALRNGLRFDPPATSVTTPRAPERATWWRLI